MAEGSAQQLTRDDAETLVAALNARDFAAIEALPSWNPEVEFRSALGTAEGEVYRGVAGLRRWAQAADETWADFRITLADFRKVSDEHFVVVYHLTGRARVSGIPLDTQTAQVWTVRNGKVWRNVAYTDPREAFAAVGLSG
jgi:ketosteroid isomerase-like protein